MDRARPPAIYPRVAAGPGDAHAGPEAPDRIDDHVLEAVALHRDHHLGLELGTGGGDPPKVAEALLADGEHEGARSDLLRR